MTTISSSPKIRSATNNLQGKNIEKWKKAERMALTPVINVSKARKGERKRQDEGEQVKLSRASLIPCIFGSLRARERERETESIKGIWEGNIKKGNGIDFLFLATKNHGI